LKLLQDNPKIKDVSSRVISYIEYASQYSESEGHGDVAVSNRFGNVSDDESSDDEESESVAEESESVII
jgi:hypothetical protein